MVSKELAKIYRRKAYSTDTLIEKREGMTIRKIFESKGEPYFRKAEMAVVQEVAQYQSVIIDCGGGVVLHPLNMKRLRKRGIIFYLQTSADSVLRQIKNSKKRPLLNVADPQARIEQLLAEREPMYLKADFILDVAHNSLPEIVKKMRRILDDE